VVFKIVEKMIIAISLEFMIKIYCLELKASTYSEHFYTSINALNLNASRPFFFLPNCLRQEINCLCSDETESSFWSNVVIFGTAFSNELKDIR